MMDFANLNNYTVQEPSIRLFSFKKSFQRITCSKTPVSIKLQFSMKDYCYHVLIPPGNSLVIVLLAELVYNYPLLIIFLKFNFIFRIFKF